MVYIDFQLKIGNFAYIIIKIIENKLIIIRVYKNISLSRESIVH